MHMRAPPDYLNPTPPPGIGVNTNDRFSPWTARRRATRPLMRDRAHGIETPSHLAWLVLAMAAANDEQRSVERDRVPMST